MDTVFDVLHNIDILIVKQDNEETSFIDCIKKKNRGQFNIYDTNNNLILIGKEYYKNNCNDWFSLQKYRPYKISIRTLDNNEVLKIKREKQCGRQGCYYCIICCCGLETCHQDILVYSGDNTQTPGRYLGRVKEKFSLFKPSFMVYDDDNNEQFKIIGQKIKNLNQNISVDNNCNWITSSSNSSHYQMKIYQDYPNQQSLFNYSTSNTIEDNDEIGEISKLYSGLKQQLFNDKDNIYIVMPPKSTVPQKSVLLGALFLINSLYYGLKSNKLNDNKNNNNNNIELNNIQNKNHNNNQNNNNNHKYNNHNNHNHNHNHYNNNNNTNLNPNNKVLNL